MNDDAPLFSPCVCTLPCPLSRKRNLLLFLIRVARPITLTDVTFLLFHNTGTIGVNLTENLVPWTILAVPKRTLEVSLFKPENGHSRPKMSARRARTSALRRGVAYPFIQAERFFAVNQDLENMSRQHSHLRKRKGKLPYSESFGRNSPMPALLRPGEFIWGLPDFEDILRQY